MYKLSWWRKLHWSEYGAELLGTAFWIFAGLSAIVFNLCSDSPLATVLPNIEARRLITGLMVAGSGSLVAISPLGKLSGAHINPAVSLAFWLQGKMHHHDLVGYVASQFAGSALGAALIVLVWGGRAASVHNGVIVPDAEYPIWGIFLIEMGLTSLLILAIFLFVSSHRLMGWTPLMTGLFVALVFWRVGPVSGSGLNPVRSFGPALVSWSWHAQWLYYLASPLGVFIAVGLFRLLQMIGINDVLTAKLFHVPHYRSIFKDCQSTSNAGKQG